VAHYIHAQIRQYFPNKHHFTAITNKDILNVVEKLNDGPGKSLGFKTSNQVFFGINPTR